MSSIQQLIVQQQENVRRLLENLKAEQQAIVSRHSQHIADCAKQKLAIIDNIKLVDYQLGHHAETPLLKTDEQLITAVAAIQAGIAECNTLNEVNGEALLRAQRTFHKLNNLLQQSRGKHQMTYNSEGQATNTRTLGTDLIA
ncbi:flagellar protein FlgN [Photobacterium ganghwense]|uniref:Molecular chaperone n=1 Tax=Photobacterium ganghwense TaxID=320778 RepID=A0A0J1HHD0_9GAMM|nr:flagellar protein FlgN [Photobacterium ganghwense]KLV11030.1 hypothetical protein ABT57_03805 [Photobacterium ganghwense]MBV1840461.1 flagellar protein FlgN [Photobacterium ganghwense]PSU11292.1 flagellar protein FlgN [Photobacterium ganghwense]QSV13411.1 flagellar protein FlgN [Photobacterium ganghwense]